LVFKRRTPKSWALWVLHLVWPQGGWGRAFNYVKHRVRRLPDSPRKISRGVFAGVLVSFTPFFGLHFVIAALIAKAMRGNIPAHLREDGRHIRDEDMAALKGCRKAPSRIGL